MSLDARIEIPGVSVSALTLSYDWGTLGRKLAEDYSSLQSEFLAAFVDAIYELEVANCLMQLSYIAADLKEDAEAEGVERVKNLLRDLLGFLENE